MPLPRCVSTVAIIFLTQLMPAHGTAGLVEHHSFTVESFTGYRECLTCHDGIIAPLTTPCLAAVCFIKSDHPIDRPYPPPDKMDRFTSYAAALQAGIEFFDMHVDCISCHNLENGGKNHLRIEDIQSSLCRACHIK